MACTEAVETVISDHYEDQLRELLSMDAAKVGELRAYISQFRDDEMHHHDTAVANDAHRAPLYSLLNGVIKVGCRTAIWVAERV